VCNFGENGSLAGLIAGNRNLIKCQFLPLPLAFSDNQAAIFLSDLFSENSKKTMSRPMFDTHVHVGQSEGIAPTKASVVQFLHQ